MNLHPLELMLTTMSLDKVLTIACYREEEPITETEPVTEPEPISGYADTEPAPAIRSTLRSKEFSCAYISESF